MEKRWVIKAETEQQTLIKLIEEVGVSKPIANILGQRCISNFEEAKNFFRPDLKNLLDPFLMYGMEKAVNRIEEAIATGENILVYGDYDVDGTTAVSLVFSYLHREYEQIGYYIPDRYKEGYGISMQGIDFAIDNSFSLVIALDCGIKAIEEIAKAKAEGVDFIVCDHHTPGEEIPDCIILNPKQNLCSYPYPELSGAGIGFKLVQALNQIRNEGFEEIEDLLDLLVVSIGADVVPISGENRIMAFHGLARLNENPRIGFAKLLELANKQGNLSMQDVIFSLAPRINAAGRIDSGNKAVELLLAQSETEVNEISANINSYNETRKGLDKEITAEALEMIKLQEEFVHLKSTVLFKEDWHKGVVGIVASRVQETYYRPTIILTESNGMAVGSGRSVKGFNIYDAIDACSDLLDRYGGHFHAAGLSLPMENLTEFKVRFTEVVNSTISDNLLVPEIEIDAEIDFRDIFENQLGGIPKFFRILRQLAPFGPENPNPIFVSRNVKNTGYSRVLKDEHLKLHLYQEEYPNLKLSGIAFGLGHLFPKIENQTFDIVYSLEENHWQGSSSLQLMVKDIQPSTPPI
ncbi:MAG: single-stranded-DNA-specific exonuclease RecJ [Flavobacteriales bacterium]|nr:single-stranded-DNA-specific exonuclease RecJ [Flavobacteriales bacterium]